MSISTFGDLLNAAREQADFQRLLFVFAQAGVPDDATTEQRERFESGQGGTVKCPPIQQGSGCCG